MPVLSKKTSKKKVDGEVSVDKPPKVRTLKSNMTLGVSPGKEKRKRDTTKEPATPDALQPLSPTVRTR
jgi:hypothetical protein